MKSDSKTKILIIDDHQVLSDSLSLTLSDDYDVVGQVSDFNKIERAVFSLNPDILIMDINLKHKSSFEIIPLLVRNHFEAKKILILTMYNEYHFFQKAKELKVGAYVLKDSGTKKLKMVIEMLINGKMYFEDSDLSYDNELSKDDFQKRNILTPREKEIVKYIQEGLTTNQIAERMNLSFETIKSHRKNIFNKLEITNDKQLVAFAFKNNL